ncbi:MAG: hypothetical protein ABSF84_10945 [Acidimicrobiales bacterium]|jgi:hypothetical protein
MGSSFRRCTSDRLPPWGDALAEIHAARVEIEDIRYELKEAEIELSRVIRVARDIGVPWEHVATELGLATEFVRRTFDTSRQV